MILGEEILGGGENRNKGGQGSRNEWDILNFEKAVKLSKAEDALRWLLRHKWAFEARLLVR